MENLNISDEFLDIDEEEKEEWIVNDDLKADWAIDKIKEINNEYKRFEDVANAKIEQIEKKLQQEKDKADREMGFFKSKLLQYFATVKPKETKTQKTYKLPSGTLKLKKAKYDFEYDKDKLLDFAEKENLNEYIKTNKTFKWGDFKKSLQIINKETIVNKETGECIDIEGLIIIEKPDEFDVQV